MDFQAIVCGETSAPEGFQRGQGWQGHQLSPQATAAYLSDQNPVQTLAAVQSLLAGALHC